MENVAAETKKQPLYKKIMIILIIIVVTIYCIPDLPKKLFSYIGK